MNAPWRIELFGGLQLVGDNGVVLSRFQTRKTGALLGYLAYYKEKPVSREVLADLFWAENDPEAARNSLRVALNSLRRQLEPPGIPPGGVLNADRATVRLNSHCVVTDTEEFERALKAERNLGDIHAAAKTSYLLQAVELYKGPLLSGWYEEWIDLEQTRLSEVYAGALRRLTHLLWKTGDYDRALDFANQAVVSDPLREENHRHLMRLYASMGRPDAALKAFRELEIILRNQINAPPSSITRELVKQIVALAAAPLSPNRVGSDVSSSIFGEVGEPLLVKSAVREAVEVPIGDYAQPTTLSVSASTVSSVSNLAGSVPLQWTRFWGRQSEINCLLGLFEPDIRNPTRLVTFSGPGGVGKTRLAIEAVAHLRQASVVGVIWFVSLDAEITGSEADSLDAVAYHEARILSRLARVLHVSPLSTSFDEAIGQITSALVEVKESVSPTLLILDGVPQTVNGLDVSARIITRLLETVPFPHRLRCFVTSRQRLYIAFEHELMVEPLPTPPRLPKVGLKSAEGAAAPVHLLEVLSSCTSVAMFVERAQGMRPDFQITPRNAHSIADLCRRLDGLPLALELAAAWSRLLTPAQMVERASENCFALLSTERRDLVPRHRSLQTVLTEACRDLSPALRSFLGALSVFHGGFSLHAAQTIGDPDALGLLDALQARSLLYVHETEHGLRFRLLQTTRCFAQTLLTSVEKNRVEEAYGKYFAELAQTAEPFLSRSIAETWRVRLDDEQENLRGLLDAARDPNASSEWVERGLQTAASLWRYWYARGLSDEGCEYLEALLHHPVGFNAPPLLRACAFHGAGRLALNLGYATRASTFFEQSFHILAEEPRVQSAASPLTALTKALVAKDMAIAARARGDQETVCNALRIVLQEKQAAGDAWGTASALTEWGNDALLHGEAQTAQTAFAQSAALRRALGDRWGAAEADAGQAQALAAMGLESADALKQQSASELTAMGDVLGIAASFLNLGYVAAEQKDWEAALPLLRDAVSLFQTQNDREAAALVLWIMARAAAEQNEIRLAVSIAEDALIETQLETKVSSAMEPLAAGRAMRPSLLNPTEAVGETRVVVLVNRLLDEVAAGTRPLNRVEHKSPFK